MRKHSEARRRAVIALEAYHEINTGGGFAMRLREAAQTVESAVFNLRISGMPERTLYKLVAGRIGHELAERFLAPSE